MRKHCQICHRGFNSLKGKADICDNCLIEKYNEQKQEKRQTKQEEIIN